MTTLADAREFLVELVSQLFHADVLITERAERIEALEAEITQLKANSKTAAGAPGPRGGREERHDQPSRWTPPAWYCRA